MTAPATERRMRRAAIYTRKSSEEGLEQDFNSLDAQRDACAAYIRSQKAEGWKALSQIFDDGGYSGGTMERPALQALLAEIALGRIDIVVVYKIDRLTRSLADFARMVELFERHKVSFVSVTQAFNTTTSMGRLTLNVLLSFAQFEREVTGERIRDKIAASKARGMWMGGTVPLGYDRPASGPRTLTVNEAEAALVRQIFATYLALGSVHALERDLIRQSIRTKRTISRRGTLRGGVPFSRGSLFHPLRNRLYLGEIIHKDRHYPGLHPAIIDKETFDAVQARLNSQARRKGRDLNGKASSPLAGKIFDADGHPMSPTFAYGRDRMLYRYYVSAPLQQGKAFPAGDPHPRRASATAIENILRERLAIGHQPRGNSHDGTTLFDTISRIEVYDGRIKVRATGLDLSKLHSTLAPNETAVADPADPAAALLTLLCRISTQHGRTEIIEGDHSGPRPDRVLIRALRSAHAMLRRDQTGLPVINGAPATPHRRRILRLAFLAPEIQKAILEGNHPRGLTLASLMDGPIPTPWSDQFKMTGIKQPKS